MTTIKNISKVITAQLKFAKSKGKVITNDLIESYYDELSSSVAPFNTDIFTIHDAPKFELYKVVKTENFQIFVTEKGIIIMNKLY